MLTNATYIPVTKEQIDMLEHVTEEALRIKTNGLNSPKLPLAPLIAQSDSPLNDKATSIHRNSPMSLFLKTQSAIVY